MKLGGGGPEQKNPRSSILVDAGWRVGAKPLRRRRCPSQPNSNFRSLGGCSSVGFVITGDGDAALATGGLASAGDLWSGQSQQTIRCQGAGDC